MTHPPRNKLPFAPPAPADAPLLSAHMKAAVLSSVAPTAADRARVQDELRMALAAGATSSTVEHTAEAMAARAAQLGGTAVSHGLGVKALLAGLAVTGAAGIVAMTVWHSRPSGADRSEPQSQMQSAQAQRQPARAMAPQLPAAEPSPAPISSRPRARVTASARARHRLRAAPARAPRVADPIMAPSPPREPPPQPDTEVAVTEAPVQAPGPLIAGELKLVSAASAALAHHQPEVALRYLSQHKARYPDGTLSREAQALRVMVACERNSAGARGERDAFLRSEAFSALAERVRGACSELR